MDGEVSKLELGVLAALAILVVLAFYLVGIQSWKDALLELLVIALIGVELVSLVFQVRTSEKG